MAPTMAISGACILKAGANVSSDLTGADGETKWNELIAQAESIINVNVRYNFTDAYATLNDDVKFILEQTASDIAAIYGIIYDMSGYTSRAEAETMINVLRDRAIYSLSMLRDKKQETFTKNA